MIVNRGCGEEGDGVVKSDMFLIVVFLGIM